MNHSMGLYDQPFEAIQSRQKLVEVRLWDEKRRQLKVGHTITFTKLSSPTEQVTVRVIALDRFPTFKDLYETLPAQILGTNGESVDMMLESTYAVYSQEQEKEWGTVAIHIEVVK